MTDNTHSQMQLDLFATDGEVESTTHEATSPDLPAGEKIVTSVAEWADSQAQASDLALLELLMTEGSRKVAFNGLEQEQRNALALAVRVVAHAKRSAYERVRRGELTSSFDWHRREPALSLAIELLNTSFIDTNAIAMA